MEPSGGLSRLNNGLESEKDFEEDYLDEDRSDEELEESGFDVDELASDGDDDAERREFEVNELPSSPSTASEEEHSSSHFPLEQSQPRTLGFAGNDDDYSLFLAAFNKNEDVDLGKWAFDDEEDFDFDYNKEKAKLMEVNDEYLALRVSKNELLRLVRDHWKNEEQEKKSRLEQTKPSEQLTVSEPPPTKQSSSGKESAEDKGVRRPRWIAPAGMQFRQPLMTAAMEEIFHAQMRQHVQLILQQIIVAMQPSAARNFRLRQSKLEAMLCRLKQMRDVSYQYQSIYGLEHIAPQRSRGDWRFLTIMQDTQQFLFQAQGTNPNCSDYIETLFRRFFPEFDETLLPSFAEEDVAVRNQSHGPVRLALDSWGFTRQSLELMADSYKTSFCDAEDKLLALIIARVGPELSCEEGYDLLPTKSLESIKRRYAQLTRRKALPNPVKELSMLMHKPLSTEEWRRVDRGIEMYGDSNWDLVQSQMLPSRDKVILEKLYKRRQRKRAQKRKERDRLKQQKTAKLT